MVPAGVTSFPRHSNAKFKLIKNVFRSFSVEKVSSSRLKWVLNPCRGKCNVSEISGNPPFLFFHRLVLRAPVCFNLWLFFTRCKDKQTRLPSGKFIFPRFCCTFVLSVQITPFHLSPRRGKKGTHSFSMSLSLSVILFLIFSIKYASGRQPDICSLSPLSLSSSFFSSVESHSHRSIIYICMYLYYVHNVLCSPFSCSTLMQFVIFYCYCYRCCCCRCCCFCCCCRLHVLFKLTFVTGERSSEYEFHFRIAVD